MAPVVFGAIANALRNPAVRYGRGDALNGVVRALSLVLVWLAWDQALAARWGAVPRLAPAPAALPQHRRRAVVRTESELARLFEEYGYVRGQLPAGVQAASEASLIRTLRRTRQAPRA